MKNIALKHQKAIAYKTLRMTPARANIMGGMTFEEAYQIIFRESLRDRLKDLIAEYGDTNTLSWELWTYGWNSPSELLNQLS